jgi:peptidyl-prolyl cis-trans isomerase D
MVVWARNGVVAAIVVAFVGFFGQPGSGPGTALVAEVEGEAISREVFEFFRAQNEGLLRQVAQENVDPRSLQDLLDRQTLDSLVRRHIISGEAVALGLRVSDKEVRSVVLAEDSFRRDGRFDRELFERFVVHSGLDSPRAYTAEVRRDLLMQKFQRLVSSPVRVSRAAAEEAVRRAGTRVRVQLAVARPEQFGSKVELTDEEILLFAEQNPARVEQAYQARIDEFDQPEEVRVRHILFTGEDPGPGAEEALRRVEGGEEFAALAEELSDDLATKGEGGDLGFFPRGRMLPAFEEVAFTLGPGEVSSPVETARGVHLIKLEERREPVTRTLDEASSELARGILLQERAQEDARRSAERMIALLRQGRDFEEAAAETGLSLQSPAPFAWTDAEIPGLGRVPGLHAAAFALEPDRPSLPRIFEVPGGFALVSLVDREEPDPETVSADLERTREQLEQELRGRMISGWYQTRRDGLLKDGRLRFFPLYRPG